MISALDSRVIDANSEALGIPVSTLMDNAGKVVAQFLNDHYPEGNILFVCGPGNNGGDGFAAALLLDPERVTVALLRKSSQIHSDIAKQKYSKLQCKVEEYNVALLNEADVIVDCALGTGIRGKVKDPYRQFILEANASGLPIVSVDVPSGLGSDVTILPQTTITFHDVKVGMNDDNCGNILVADVGIPVDAMKFIGPGDVLRYPLPDENSHKGENGRLMIIAGGPYFGAPAMCSMAALRTGADIVRLFTPETVAHAISTYCPVLMITPLPGDHLSTESVDMLLEQSMYYDAVLLGPGIGKDPDTMLAVKEFVRKCKTPMVIDADALTAIIGMEILSPAIITPHKGEFRKLDSQYGGPEPLAQSMNVTLLLKGHVDTITDGNATRYNKAGTPAMTGAGTGDVLSGAVAALLSKGLSTMEAAALGAFLSGKAGEYAFKDKSYGLIATDIIEEIPHVLRDNLR
ncbi:carbohydrate kinase YjeF related protein [methanogenic archaeon mixed culture ISO4-G1]|nr:carbohydrate kinase YjeF related protein [methanogenic archaeon mixed culture ISO4-G1]